MPLTFKHGFAIGAAIFMILTYVVMSSQSSRKASPEPVQYRPIFAPVSTHISEVSSTRIVPNNLPTPVRSLYPGSSDTQVNKF